METVRIRDPGWKKVGPGINIPDPQHCAYSFQILIKHILVYYTPTPAFSFVQISLFSSSVLAVAVHIPKLERYRED
jgi:hypothetical protein